MLLRLGFKQVSDSTFKEIAAKMVQFGIVGLFTENSKLADKHHLQLFVGPEDMNFAYNQRDYFMQFASEVFDDGIDGVRGDTS